MPLPSPRTLGEIVARYRFDHQERASRELRAFAIQKSLAKAIRLAGVATTPSGKRFNHQRRIPAKTLAAVEATLQSRRRWLADSTSFEELHHRLEVLMSPIRGIGDLMIYDTAMRIGAFLRLRPNRVYLHAGTKKGASYLGLGRGRRWLKVNELPEPLRALRAHEIEDCLCIYKETLAAMTGEQTSQGRWSDRARTSLCDVGELPLRSKC